MDTQIGAKEIAIQKRLLNLFDKQLNYIYLGDWKDRENNSIPEERWFKALVWMRENGFTPINNSNIK